MPAPYARSALRADRTSARGRHDADRPARRGYGHTTPAAQDAEQRAEASGWRLETVYTAEALAALLAMDGAGASARNRGCSSIPTAHDHRSVRRSLAAAAFESP
jgi:hypothetical protein